MKSPPCLALLAASKMAAKDSLRKIWNRIIVGAEPSAQGVSMEYAMASNRLLRVGVLILGYGRGLLSEVFDR